jgi:hypothetical protein
MLAKNTRATVATVAVALITGLMVALWVALMSAPAQASNGPNPVTEPPLPSKQCNDGIDNDSDGKIDYGTGASSDPGCSHRYDNTENSDNSGTITPPPPPPKQCDDGKDNDNDGKIDFGTGANNDPGCESATDNDEINQPNTAPTIDPIKPVDGSKIRNRSPLIAAKVSDAETDLTRSNIKLFVDGKPITKFSYDAATDRLSYRSGKLAYGGHKVKVKATDADGLEGKKPWRFKVVRR